MELNSEQILVDTQDSRDDNRYGEIFLDEHVIKVERFFDKLAVIIAVIPEVELAIEGKTLGFMFLLLHC